MEQAKIDVGGPELWILRGQTAKRVTSLIRDTGVIMANTNNQGELGESIRSLGAIMQMCGELGNASANMLSGKEHYAGAALLRQIVEIEYLTWTFENGHAEIRKWRNSPDKERMKQFSPAQLRKNSKGRFLYDDYKNHCERGGHPVPRGIPLLGGKSTADAQLLLVDLLLHCWRTWDQVSAWLRIQKHEIPEKAMEIGFTLANWGKQDPVYIYSCSQHPEPNPRKN